MASATASISSHSIALRDLKGSRWPCRQRRPRASARAVRLLCAAEPSRKPVSASAASAPVAPVEEEASAAASVDYEALALELVDASPLEIMDRALDMFGSEIAIAFSGAEDVALIEYAKLTGRPFRVFSLDTGRLNPETYQLFDKVEKHYGVLQGEEGSAIEEGPQGPQGLDHWAAEGPVPGTRASIPVVQVDPSFEGLDGGAGSLIKWNPVANVDGLRLHWVRAVHQARVAGAAREGREVVVEDATAKECGLHKGNIDKEGQTPKVGVNGNGSAEASAPDIFQSQAIVNLTCPGIENLLRLENCAEPWLAVPYAPWCPYCQAMEASYVELAEQLSGSGIKVAKFRADGEQKSFAQAELQLQSFPTILLFPGRTVKPIKHPSEKRDVQSLLAS
ncbi:hypothetical protein ZWY2020_004093 [Hordeum vulgare]|nr:hypothetical protein ZWY2020_004093 [Hordeum vulgare]